MCEDVKHDGFQKQHDRWHEKEDVFHSHGCTILTEETAEAAVAVTVALAPEVKGTVAAWN